MKSNYAKHFMNNNTTIFLNTFKARADARRNFKIEHGFISEKACEKLPVLSGDLNSLNWNSILPVESLLENNKLKDFFDKQAPLFEFFKKNNLFNSLIEEILHFKTEDWIENNSDFIKKIKEIYPAIDINSKYGFGADYQEEFGYKKQKSDQNILILERALGATTALPLKIVIEAGIDCFPKGMNPFKSIENAQVLTFFLNTFPGSYEKIIQDSNGGAFGYSALKAPCVFHLHTIIDKQSRPEQSQEQTIWNTLNSKSFISHLYTIREEFKFAPETIEWVSEHLNKYPLLIDKKMGDHITENWPTVKTFRDVAERMEYQKLSDDIKKIDKRVEIQKSIENKKSKPKQKSLRF